MINKNKKSYIQASINRKPINILVELLEKIEKTKERNALDLGCGAGIEAKYLAQKGFLVDAVDSSKESISQTKKTCKNFPVNVVERNIFEYEIKPKKYSIIVFWNVLPFLEKTKSLELIKRIEAGIITNGYLVFSFYGPKDDWVRNRKISPWKIEEFKKILTEMNIIKISEIKETAPLFSGEIKFWHKIHGIAQKKKGNIF